MATHSVASACDRYRSKHCPALLHPRRGAYSAFYLGSRGCLSLGGVSPGSYEENVVVKWYLCSGANLC